MFAWLKKLLGYPPRQVCHNCGSTRTRPSYFNNIFCLDCHAHWKRQGWITEKQAKEIRKRIDDLYDDPLTYQTVTLVLSDGRRVHYTGRAQIDHTNPTKVVEVIISKGEPLPPGMTWDKIP